LRALFPLTLGYFPKIKEKNRIVGIRAFHNILQTYGIKLDYGKALAHSVMIVYFGGLNNNQSDDGPLFKKASQHIYIFTIPSIICST
jgi:hypothetical protein